MANASGPGIGRDDGIAASRRRIDPQVALDLLARQMWITHSIDRGFDGVLAAETWDGDDLLTDKYEEFEALARGAISAETKNREEADRG